MRAAFAAFLATLTRADRDERLCREIVARGICAPTSDLGIAVRATLARVDALRGQRDDMWTKWGESHGNLLAARDYAGNTLAECERLAEVLDKSRTQVVELRRRLDAAESAPPHTASGDALSVCMGLLGVKTYAATTAAIKALLYEVATLRGIHRDMLRVVGERDEARRELVVLRESVRNVARRMAEQISEVSQ